MLPYNTDTGRSSYTTLSYHSHFAADIVYKNIYLSGTKKQRQQMKCWK